MVSPNSLYGPLDPAPDAGYEDAPPRMGFFTDTSVCIGCKACEVACKEWNLIPDDGFDLLGMSYDNTGSLGASTWRHVAFVEQPVPPGRASAPFAGTPTGPSGIPAVVAATTAGVESSQSERMGTDDTGLAEQITGAAVAAQRSAREGVGAGTPDGGGSAFLGMPGSARPEADGGRGRAEMRWLMASDVCKHCTHAACLDVCPTGSLFRTEFGTVVVQEDICNGCGYCIPACPFGVIDQRKDDGRAWKCTLCYDRIGVGKKPACATACPTESIQYGPLDELRARAAQRVDQLHSAGVPEARLYGDDPEDGVGGVGAFFLLLDEPEVYGLPPDPVVTTRDLPAMWRRAGAAALAMAGAAVLAFTGRRA